MRAIAATSISLGSFYRDHTKHLTLVPPHQWPRSEAGGSWDNKRKMDWINQILTVAKNESLTSVQKLLGGCTAVTYKQEGCAENSPKYINDGVHRTINSINWHLANLNSQQEKNEFLSILDQVQITEHFMIYSDLDEAIEHFIKLNTSGSVGNVYQIFSGKLVSYIHHRNDSRLTDLQRRIENAIPQALVFLGLPSSEVGFVLQSDNEKVRARKQKFLRDSRASFLKFTNKIKTQAPYQGVSNKYLDRENENQGHTKIEDDLIDLFRSCTHDELLDIVKKWESFIDKAIAFYKQIFNENFNSLECPEETPTRWWISSYIYFFNNNVKTDSVRKFTETFFKKWRGKTSFRYTNEKGIEVPSNAQLQKYNDTYLVCFDLDKKEFYVGSDRADGRKPKREKRKSKMHPGFDNSHIKTLSVHGEGESLPENSRENRSRGPKDMTNEEQQRVRIANGDSSQRTLF